MLKMLSEVRDLTENKMREYNDERPHDSPGALTPWKYLAGTKTGKTLILSATKVGRVTSG